MVQTATVPYDPHAAIRGSLRLSLIVLAVLVVGGGGLAATTGISGAVIANGQVVVSSDVKVVQHPTGGWWPTSV